MKLQRTFLAVDFSIELGNCDVLGNGILVLDFHGFSVTVVESLFDSDLEDEITNGDMPTGSNKWNRRVVNVGIEVRRW